MAIMGSSMQAIRQLAASGDVDSVIISDANSYYIDTLLVTHNLKVRSECEAQPFHAWYLLFHPTVRGCIHFPTIAIGG